MVSGNPLCLEIEKDNLLISLSWNLDEEDDLIGSEPFDFPDHLAVSMRSPPSASQPYLEAIPRSLPVPLTVSNEIISNERESQAYSTHPSSAAELAALQTMHPEVNVRVLQAAQALMRIRQECDKTLKEMGVQI